MEVQSYTISADSNSNFVLKGSMRLKDPLSYEKPFEPMKKMLESGKEITVDLTQLHSINSSGHLTLAHLILRSKEVGSLIFICNENIPWQKKLESSLKSLSPNVVFKIINVKVDV